MPEQTQSKRATVKEEVKSVPPKDIQSKGDELKEEIDNLVDLIDGVLEENAEEFVQNYVQKGGE